tara:strand:+ start:185 stop:907 length:723 start_codon:yes stop_codon:yes gene_type:complete
MRFKFYILISLIIHLIIIIFYPNNIKKEKLKGKKIIPIEIIQNKSFNSSKGNTNKNSTKIIPKKIQDKKKEIIKNNKKFQESNDLKLKERTEKVKGNFQIKKNKINERTKINKNQERNSLVKEKELDAKISNPQIKGLSAEDNKKDIEKGSIKGKGELKITCLSCVSPRYPRKALKKGLEGKPTVKVWILKNGNVEKVELIISSGIKSIDNAALEAAQESKFYPIESNSFINIQYDLKLR